MTVCANQHYHKLLIPAHSGEIQVIERILVKLQATVPCASVDIGTGIRYRDPSDATTIMSTFTSIDGFFNWRSWESSRVRSRIQKSRTSVSFRPADVDSILTIGELSHIGADL